MLPSGGGIRVARQYSRILKEKFSLTVYRPEGGSLMDPEHGIEEDVIPFALWKKPTGILRSIAPVFLMARLLSFKLVCKKAAERMNSRADIALIHNSLPVAAPPVLNYLKIPSLYFCYEYPRHIYEKDLIRRTDSHMKELALRPLEALEKHVDFRSARNATGIATFSTYMMTMIRHIYHRDSDIIKPGVDTDFFHPASDGVREKYVLSVGALWPYKGHDTAVRILHGIPGPERPYLRIVSDRAFPGYVDELKSLAETLSVRIEIESGISDGELRTRYQRAAAVLCCQRREPYGLVPLEAMACGVPVLAVSEGGFTDNVISGETGFLFDGSPETGSEVLAQIMSNPATGNHAAAGALEFVRKHRNLRSGSERLKEVLENL